MDIFYTVHKKEQLSKKEAHVIEILGPLKKLVTFSCVYNQVEEECIPDRSSLYATLLRLKQKNLVCLAGESDFTTISISLSEFGVLAYEDSVERAKFLKKSM